MTFQRAHLERRKRVKNNSNETKRSRAFRLSDNTKVTKQRSKTKQLSTKQHPRPTAAAEAHQPRAPKASGRGGCSDQLHSRAIHHREAFALGRHRRRMGPRRPQRPQRGEAPQRTPGPSPGETAPVQGRRTHTQKP